MRRAQLGLVLDEFKRLGWKPAPPRSPRSGAAPVPTSRAADHPVARKARALWVSLHQLGVVHEPAERALEAFAARQLGVERLQWADQAQGHRLIEALKAMAGRAGWDQAHVVQPAHGPHLDPVRVLKQRLVRAQWGRLVELGSIRGGEPPACAGLAQWANGGVTPCVKALEQWTDAELEAAAASLGRWINRVLARRAPPG